MDRLGISGAEMARKPRRVRRVDIDIVVFLRVAV